MKTNQEVISDFTDGIESKNRNLFAERDNFGRLVLYSYGYHFPMALKLDDGNFVFNKSKYSQTTSCHQGIFLRLGSVNLIKNTDTDGLKELIKKDFQTFEDLTEQNI